MDKYLITGYSGFVSHHFLNYLESQEIKCDILGVDISNPNFNTTNYKHLQCNFIKVNLLDKLKVDEILNQYKPNFILHLASYSSVADSWKNPVVSFVNNTNIFLNLVDQVRFLNFKCRIISVGSSEEYGKINLDDLPLHELSPINPTSPYAVARVSQEMLSKIYSNNYGLDIILTRSFNHLGPQQSDNFVISSFVKKLVTIKKYNSINKSINVGNIDVVRDFVDVRDVVRAYFLLLHKGKSGEIYNICSGIGTSIKDILNNIINILKIEVDIVVDKDLIRPADNKIIIGSNDKIKNDVGWEINISLEQSIIDVIKYWEEKI